MTFNEKRITQVLESIECTRADNQPFTFNLDYIDAPNSEYLYLQVEVMAADTYDPSGPLTRQAGRKWLLSQHMTTTEIVQTAWKAVEAFEVHELQERFRYKGACIFNSHVDAEERAKIASIVDVRS